MSRIAKAPIPLPKNVEFQQEGRTVKVKGPKGALQQIIHEFVEIVNEDNVLRCVAKQGASNSLALAGTTRSLVNNMVIGVSNGFQKKLQLVGVGYRAQMQGQSLHLALGYSHPINFPVPEGLSIETPTQTEVIVSGIDKQKVGQAAAIIRGFRPPEPYKGKGVKYANEIIICKEAKKK